MSAAKHQPDPGELLMRLRVYDWMTVVGAARGLLHLNAADTSESATAAAAQLAADDDLEFVKMLLPDRRLEPDDAKRALRKILQRAIEILDRESMSPNPQGK